MNFDRRYWIFIGSAMSCATLASTSTPSTALVQEHFMNCAASHTPGHNPPAFSCTHQKKSMHELAEALTNRKGLA